MPGHLPRLPEPRTRAGADGLRAVLTAPAGALIATDFDGTLAPIVPRPEDARPVPGALDALAALARRVGAMAIITGRPVTDVLALSGVHGVPGLEGLVVLGQYGVERWDAATGAISVPEPAPGVAAVRERLPGLLAELSAPPGTAIEDKGLSLVLHVRRTQDPAAAVQALGGPVRELADRHGLEAEPGRMVLEIRPPGGDKGGALLALVRERAATAVLFAGDDLGDLPAFAAVETLRAGGVPGVTVASWSPETPDVAARADLVVPGPAGVVDLFTAMAGALDA